MVIEAVNNVSVIRLPSKFDMRLIKEFADSTNEALEMKFPAVAVDFSITTYIDSSAIGALVTLAKECRITGTVLLLRNLNPKIRQLFEDTELDRVFNIETAQGTSQASAGLFEQGAQSKLEIRSEERGDVRILCLNGVLNHPVGSRFFKQEFLLALTDRKKILLDLSQLSFFDSLGVSEILTMNRLLKETGGSLRIYGANHVINDLFITVGINRVVPFFHTLDEALADWNTA